MDRLSHMEEKELVGAVEKAIRYTHEDLSPNDAILKVATDRQYNPEYVKRMVEAFNKSKSMHVLDKAAAEDKARPFDLADPQVILRAMFNPPEKVASSFALPSGDFSTMDLGKTFLNKEASEYLDLSPLAADDAKKVDRLLKQAAEDREHICSGIREELRMKIQMHKHAFEESIISAVSQIRKMGRQNLRKTAQNMINMYPDTGPQLMRILEHKSNIAFPSVEKTASAVILPTKEPYLTIAKIYGEAQKMAQAEVEADMFEKGAAEPFMSSVAANTLANMMAGLGMNQEDMQSLMSGSKKKYKPVEEDLDPQFYNRMKSHDAKRTFMQLALFDDDLKQYEHNDLLKAYNDTVQSLPEAYGNPSALKNLMLRNL